MAQLSAFNPHEYSPAQLNALATAREAELARALDTIRSNLSAETMQHLIISAPRGYGKSFLMRHIQVEAQRIAETEKLPLAVVLMPEEMPHVKEPETLILEITRALTGGGGETAQLRWHEDDGEAWEAAVFSLQAAITETLGKDGLLVALVENFDQLLRRAFRQDVHAQRLRNLITLPGGRLMLIAASASGAIDRDYDKALFQAFAEIALQPWSVDECMRFFARQREAVGKPPLDEAAHAQAKAVANFIGGTPRLATLLGEQLLDGDLLNAADLLCGLVDELTPYYKARIESLPGRSQLLLDALLRGGEPATQSEIATRVQANSQAAIAAPFHDLKNERAIIGLKAPDSAEVLYRVADRVFAHYYRRRIIDHGRELCPLEGLVDLLSDFYNPKEKEAKALELLRLGYVAEARVLARLHDQDLGNPKSGRRQVLNGLVTLYIPRRLKPLASSAGRQALDSIAVSVKNDDIDQAYSRVDAGLRELAALPDQVVLLLVRAVLDRFEGLGAGLSAAEKAVSIAQASQNKNLMYETKVSLAESFNLLDRKEESLDLFLQMLEIARSNNIIHDQIEFSYSSALLFLRLEKKHQALEMAISSCEMAISNNLSLQAVSSFLLASMISTFLENFFDGIKYYGLACIENEKLGKYNLTDSIISVGEDVSKIISIKLINSNNIENLIALLHSIFCTNSENMLKISKRWLHNLIAAAICSITNPSLLEELANRIEIYFPERFPFQISLIRITEEYHRGGRNADYLARLEPDFARTLKVIFPPADPPPDAPPKAKRGSGRRRKSP
jgi:hypothetical protein